MDFREIGWEGVDWIHLTQLGTSDGKCLDYLSDSISRRTLLHGVSYGSQITRSSTRTLFLQNRFKHSEICT